MAQTETSSGASRRRGSAALRAAGFAAAIILGGVAIWLIATSDTVKSQRIGALAGMWGALVGAYAVFGARRHDHDLPAEPGSALELRHNAALARSEDVASQREFQARLEAMLRREVQEGVSRELAGLRNEVAALRSEILENVGGQLRMERTETTRLFGSNLEALQREVNQLKVRQLADDPTTIEAIEYHVDPPARAREPEPAREVPHVAAAAERSPQPGEPTGSGAFPPFRPLEPMRPFGPRAESPVAQSAAATGAGTDRDSPAPRQAPAPREEATRPVARDVPTPLAPYQSGPIPYLAPAPALAQAPAQALAPAFAAAQQPAAVRAPEPAGQQPVPQRAPDPGPQPVPAQQPAPPAAAPRPTPDPAPQAAASVDPFASMPRITPFTDFELDVIERPPSQSWGSESAAGAGAGLSGRHATVSDPVADGAGGRRRRADDSENDVLARILAREKSPGEDE